MNSPRLNRKLALEAPDRVPDGAGGFEETWVTLGTLWAEIIPGTGAERLAQAAPLSRARWTITVRAAPYNAPSRPRPEHRFRDGDRVFQILSVQESDADVRYLICRAEEEVAT